MFSPGLSVAGVCLYFCFPGVGRVQSSLVLQTSGTSEKPGPCSGSAPLQFLVPGASPETLAVTRAGSWILDLPVVLRFIV